MKKKIYNSPLIEVEQISLTGILMESPDTPTPPIHPGAPGRKVPALGNDSVQVF